MNLNDKQKTEYWTQRAEQRLINAENLTSDMLVELRKTYAATITQLEKEVNAFYGKYATETGLDLTEVRKRLNPKELKDFKTQLKKYYDEVQRLGGYSPDTKLYLRELSAKAYISRLEELQTQMRWQVENLYRTQQLKLFDVLSKGYEDTYLRATFDMQQGIGFAYSFSTLDDRKVRLAVTQKWQGSNFSERIWADKARLIDTLNTTIPQGVALGQNPRKVAQTIAKSMNTRYSNAERLARTEMNHICNESARQAYNEVPEVLQEYKIVATLDNRTSDLCFIGTDEIQTVSDVEKLFKRNYTGKIITITTASGNQITGTPNHPVLTSEGWLPLDKINPNKHIVYSVLNNSVGIISKKNIDVPTKLTELFNSFSKIARGKVLISSTPTTKLNNNRTIRNSKINVLSTDRILRNWRQTIFNKHIIKNFFAFIHNSINLLSLRMLEFLFFRRELINMTSEVEIFTFSKFIKPTFRPIQLFDNLSWFKSVVKHINSSCPINIILAIMFAPLKMLHNPEFLKKCCNSSSSSFILFCNFASGHTIPVFADNVIGKSVKFTNNCHVYNLQTKDNVYINNKIIVHNCQVQDGKTYKMSEWEEGITAPPFHPNCRTTTVPYFPEMDSAEYNRIATDYETGKSYFVPANMSYKEWRASLSTDQEKAFIADKKIREQHNADKKQLSEYRKLRNYAEKNGQGELFANVPMNKISDFQTYKYTEPEKYEILKENARIIRSEMK